MVRTYRFLEREGALQLRTDRQRFRPWGLAGGREGTPSSNLLTLSGQEQVPPSKAYFVIHDGDVLRHTLAGAGGHGDPLARDPELVAEDVLDEKVTLESARRDYGVVIEPRTGRPDAAATASLRAEQRAVASP